MLFLSSHALASDLDNPGRPGLGVIYYGHPGSSFDDTLPRANYTVHKSVDGGDSWQFYSLVYQQFDNATGGSGYRSCDNCCCHFVNMDIH